MGIIRAGISAAGGTLSDQYFEAIEADHMSNTTLMTKGVLVGRGEKRNHNRGSAGVITDGSLIHVEENQMMLLVDGGKIIDYSAEPGYYQVDNQNAPSLLNGDFGGALSDAFNRLKFGGTTPYRQEVYYINTQEIQDIPFGTTNAINYFDEFYNAELYIRAHGYYSVRITNPLLFYSEMVSRNTDRMDIDSFRKLSLSEFLTAFQTSIGKMSVEGVRISHLSSKTSELAQHMANTLDEDWEKRRGLKIMSVGISSISYDDKSKELIDMRNQGAMLGDANVRSGYVQGAAARGMESAGSNPGGAMSGFYGVNMGMEGVKGFAEATKAEQPAPAAPVQTEDLWTCSNCEAQNKGGKFCHNCGTPRAAVKFCPNCGAENAANANFCNECGTKLS